MTRRRWSQLSLSALLALGLWPGCARFRDNGRGGSFRFVVLNDSHFQTPNCAGWFDRARQSIQALDPEPEFCLMLGDLGENGTTSELGGMRDALRSFGMPFYTVPGNHDYASDTDRSVYDTLFPRRLNYSFEHREWQFIGLDSTEGTRWQQTSIQPATFTWLDRHVPRLDPARPTILFTHFPLGSGVRMRPGNADALLRRLQPLNLVAIFNGHFHGFTERTNGPTIITTNKCCALSRDNHDGTKEKGYFVCDVREGRIARQFVGLTGAALATRG